ncbi:16S rRNA (cytidine(1402)-2'-O)-methyltransferase [uncultured Mailhella sp.]|uniref:16S rRNA (cytidine(1402)-2'-O)-methyltransferase n=1 Tax=uncultured Mailhella sp. TaxID=1981031 RepID=UPI00260F0C75|nr:16S rRNA (cytidine(1402)-2'-O)-methyltransferase [uncultured Mailhella sp.]
MHPGTLWVVGTPLGNPGDLSPRARQCLETANVVLAEDTRREALACARWGVQVKRFVSFHDHNEKEKLSTVLTLLRQGQDLALISDAGMPVLADPGYTLIRACREAGLPVSVVPGPCAPVTALAGSGIPPQPFVFFGFLPRSRSDQEATLAPFANVPVTLVFFERKDRLQDTLTHALSLLGPREVCVARELTKTHEEYLRFRLESVPDLSEILGEVTVIIGPLERTVRSSREEVLSVIAEEQPLGGTPRAVARRVQTRVYGWTTGEIYSILPRIQVEKADKRTRSFGTDAGDR